MAEAEIVDFQSCCRLCLTEIVEGIKSIFDETVEDRRLSLKIQQSVAIKINTSDRLSTKVCEPCIEKVTGWYNYKEQCLQNQKKLDDWIKSKSPDTESTVTSESNTPPESTATPELPPASESTVAPESIVTTELNSSFNSASSSSLADMSLQIKEEPQDHIEEPQDHVLQEDVLNNPLDMLDTQLDQQNDIRPELIHHNHVVVKTEPLYMDGLDEPMEEEYSEFPPTLSPHHLENGDDLQEPLVVRTSAFNRTCSICGKLFSNAGNKKKHERMQHGLHNNISIATPIINGLTNGDGLHGSPVPTEQQQILKTMSFKILKTIPIETPENLTKIENSYGEKCKAMVSMHKSLICACHNVPHQNLKGLLSHLRALRIWFPVFTCYNCMITFTDRSTFTRHISRCQSAPLDTITKLSELKIRTEVKTRLYQNFKCTICKFMFSFHEHFCKHVDEDHAMLQFPVHCPCGKTCETEEEYKDHVYVSCLVEFYCDICFVTTKTLDDFQKHAAGVHDDSEGFILLQDDNYKVRKPSMHISPTGVDEGAILQGKRERKASFKTPLYDEELDEILPTSLATATYYTPKSANINRVCPICYKEYSSYKNMMRHFKTHKTEEMVNPQEQQQLDQGFGDFQDFQDTSQESQDMDLEDEESFYSCPDCGGMFSTIEWKIHLTEKHQSKACGECGKFFQFQTELDQHRSVHLNLKVYRDSKTQSYKSTMISPGGEDDEMLGCEMCDLIFTSKEDLMTHQLEQGHAGTSSMEVPEIKQEIITAPKKYICDICEQEFNNYNGLWEHNRTRHPERKTPHADTYPKQCKDCDKVCTTGAAYYRHRQIHEKVPTDAGASKASLLKPKKSGEPDEESYHTCKRCFKVFSSKYNLKNHLKCHGITINPVSKKLVRKAVCKVCQHVFDTNEELIKHKQEAHNSVETPLDDMDMASLVFPCDTCVMTFNSKVALKKHKEKHSLEYKSLHRQVYCKYCKISFENFQSLTKHMQLEHDEKVNVPPKAKPNDFTCSICQKSFQSAGALTTHIGWHKRALNDSSSKLLKHIPPPPPPAPAVQLSRLHQVNIKEEPMDDVSKHQCDTCLAELPNDTALQVHILEKHRSVSAIMLIPRCNTCNKDFSTQDEYETHKRLHDFLERQKQHEQKMLVQQQEIPSPRMSQSNKQKSFPCKHCNAAFSRSDTLGAHIRQFHKEHVQTEFKCNQCDRVFEKQNSLTIHLKVHEKQRAATAPAGKPLFSCSICSMGFDLPKDLRAHTITAHPF